MYWIGNITGKQDNYCKGFCPSCRYYEICKADKNEKESIEHV